MYPPDFEEPLDPDSSSKKLWIEIPEFVLMKMYRRVELTWVSILIHFDLRFALLEAVALLLRVENPLNETANQINKEETNQINPSLLTRHRKFASSALLYVFRRPATGPAARSVGRSVRPCLVSRR